MAFRGHCCNTYMPTLINRHILYIVYIYKRREVSRWVASQKYKNRDVYYIHYARLEFSTRSYSLISGPSLQSTNFIQMQTFIT